MLTLNQTIINVIYLMPWNINCYFVKIYMQEKNKFYVNYKKTHAITMIIVHIKAMTERW